MALDISFHNCTKIEARIFDRVSSETGSRFVWVDLVLSDTQDKSIELTVFFEDYDLGHAFHAAIQTLPQRKPPPCPSAPES